MTYTQSELIPSLSLPFGMVVAKINCFKDLKVNISLKPWQDGKVGGNSHKPRKTGQVKPTRSFR